MFRKLILCLSFLPAFLFAQYYYERSTEQNFETSDFYFSRYSFNPFGMYNFKEITPGLIDNPFLNIYINPARITENKERFNLHIDYRGERTPYELKFVDFPVPHAAPEIISQDYVQPYPYYITQTRLEPEPKFSIGLIGKPFKSFADKFFVGASFQRIHKAEKFYSMPYAIYYPFIGYDPFGNRIGEVSQFPVYDRFSGKDEMLTSANLFSIFSGYKLNEQFSVGLQLSKINHLRDGGYRTKTNDDFGNIDDKIQKSDYLINRSRDYKQIDYTFGLTYSENYTKVGLKIGLLNGKANQSVENINYHLLQQNQPDVSLEWNVNLNDYRAIQNWNNSGNIYFGGVDVSYQINQDIQLVGYFNYSGGNIDFKNSSNIKDTSYYYSKFVFQSNNQSYWNKSKSSYFLIDNRTGSGVKKKSDYSGLTALRWKLSPKLKVTFGLAYFEQNIDIKSKEPVLFETVSIYNFNSSNPNYQLRNTYLRVFEDKVLEWNYNSTHFSYQIPVIFDFIVSEKLEFSVLINQISGGTKIKEYTDAHIRKRIRTEDDSTKHVNNVVERYTYPTVHNTFDRTDIIGKFNLSLHPNLNFSFLIDPELIPRINVAQVWFSIQAKL